MPIEATRYEGYGNDYDYRRGSIAHSGHKTGKVQEIGLWIFGGLGVATFVILGAFTLTGALTPFTFAMVATALAVIPLATFLLGACCDMGTGRLYEPTCLGRSVYAFCAGFYVIPLLFVLSLGHYR